MLEVEDETLPDGCMLHWSQSWEKTNDLWAMFYMLQKNINLKISAEVSDPSASLDPLFLLSMP